MSLRTLIVDDEPLAREELKYLLSAEPEVEVCGESSNGIEAVQLIRETAPDLVFLDVQMPGLDGFAVIKRLLDKKARMPQIVFATAFDQYAVRAFEVNAVDYLLKPFDKKRVQQAVGKAVRRNALKAQAQGSGKKVEAAADPAAAVPAAAADGGLPDLRSLLKLLEQQAAPAANAPQRIVVRAQNRLLLVDQKDICYASIEEGTISVVTPALEGTSNYRTLEELQEALNPAIFWRAHRSHVVNINHIKEVVPWFKSTYQLRMGDRRHSELPVARAQTKRLRELFNL
jgi:two-component system, LytTR family, response regulator LytT